MKLSVIIVNYNVRAYLEQCLRTVFKALDGVAGEVFVVDNLSTDGSVEMVREKFPQVRLIANQENVGFSRANNQAIRESGAEYVLLLNPDTVVGEDVFRKVIAFLDAHPKAGGLGVKMIDGRGHFLPESKRGLPTPSVAFFKITGLTRLFPHSRVFGRYHLGHLAENEAAPIEILSGACMFLRRSTLDQVGLLDESFFMYGEDIDLSYRITLGGYENWYFPDARIVHYKGESTKKSSVNYVFVFYNAMAIFAQKHFTRRRTNVFSMLINGSIYLSAAGAIVVRFLTRMLLPMLDLVVTLGLSYWAFLAFVDHDLDRSRLFFDLLKATLIVQAVLALFGAYDRPVRLANVGTGMLAVVVLAAGLLLALPGHSIAWSQLAIAAIWLTTCFCLVRILLHMMRFKGYSLRDRERQHVLAIGSKAEADAALSLLWQTHFGLGWKGAMHPEAVDDGARTVAQAIRQRSVDEVVFCTKDMPWQRVIAWMEALQGTQAEFKIAQPRAEFIIGPSSIESLQDLLVLDIWSVRSASGRRTKRLVDVSMSIVLLILFPVLFWMVDGRRLLRNIGAVLLGHRTWVGYAPTRSARQAPVLQPGILNVVSAMEGPSGQWFAERSNLTYAKDYRPWRDVRWMFSSLRRLGA